MLNAHSSTPARPVRLPMPNRHILGPGYHRTPQKH